MCSGCPQLPSDSRSCEARDSAATARTKEGQTGFGVNPRQSMRAATRAKAREGEGEAGVRQPFWPLS